MPLTELFNIDWRETSFVPAGDNPEARLVMWKNAPTLTDEEIEEVLREASAPDEGEGPLSKFRSKVAALVPGFGKHLDGTKFDHDQSTHGGDSKGSSGSKGGGSKGGGSDKPGDGKPGDGKPGSFEGSTKKIREVLGKQLDKNEGLKGHKNDLVKAARFLALEDDDWANDWFANVPLRLRGEAKNAVAKALEAIGVKVEYTKYEDGSRAPTGIKSRPDGMLKKSTEAGFPTFDDELRRRQRDAVRAEANVYVSALMEALDAGLYGGPIDGTEGLDALAQSADEFAAAIKEAIPMWASGKTSLAKGEGDQPGEDGEVTAPTRKEGPVPISEEQRNALPEEVRGYLTELEARPAPTGTETTDDVTSGATEDPVQKMLKEFPDDHPLRAHIEKQEREQAADRQLINKMVEDGAMERLEKRARGAGAEDPKEFAKTLRSIEKSVGEDEAEKVAKQLEAANAKAASNVTDLIKVRQDPNAQANEDTALGKANKLAKAKVEAEPQKFGKMDPAAAMASARAEVWGENPDLQEEYRQESA